VPEEALRPHVPDALSLETFDGGAWLGVTPFRLSALRVRGLLPLPVVSTFPELNVRTYVSLDDRPGIFFLSLDAASPLAVEAARLVYKLPYFRARMSVERSGDWLEYSSTRTDERGHQARFRGRYRPVGTAAPAARGSREHFLTERYCLYTLHEGSLHRAEIHHPPWRLQTAEAEIEENSMPPPDIELRGEPLCHYSERQDVVIWRLEPVPLAA
jgi:uncharacterized protein YqjF (DUF2071 family)